MHRITLQFLDASSFAHRGNNPKWINSLAQKMCNKIIFKGRIIKEKRLIQSNHVSDVCVCICVHVIEAKVGVVCWIDGLNENRAGKKNLINYCFQRKSNSKWRKGINLTARAAAVWRPHGKTVNNPNIVCLCMFSGD